MADSLPGDQRRALRPAEAAGALGISERTLRSWMRHEGLPYARVGGAILIPVADLDRWLAERTERERRADEIADAILDGLRRDT